MAELDLIIGIILIVLVILMDITVILFTRSVNKEFNNIYGRLYDLEKKDYTTNNILNR